MRQFSLLVLGCCPFEGNFLKYEICRTNITSNILLTKCCGLNSDSTAVAYGVVNLDIKNHLYSL